MPSSQGGLSQDHPLSSRTGTTSTLRVASTRRGPRLTLKRQVSRVQHEGAAARAMAIGRKRTDACEPPARVTSTDLAASSSDREAVDGLLPHLKRRPQERRWAPRGRRFGLAQRALRAAMALLARRSMYARLACSARRRRSSGGSLPSGSTSFSNRFRNAWRAGRVRALRSAVRLHETSAAIRRLMSFVAMWHHLLSLLTFRVCLGVCLSG
jgi:hypothetical protein